jgi:CHAT domain-containing protein
MQASRQHLHLGQESVRLRLRFDPELFHIAHLPWEFLYGGDDLGFLCVQSNVAVVRDLSPEEMGKQPRAKRPLRVLLAWAKPEEDWLPSLDVQAELDAIDRALQASVAAGRLEVRKLAHAQHGQFLQEVQKGYDLIHFIGHGGVEQGAGVLYFEDEDRAVLPMSRDTLLELLAEPPTMTDRTPKLVVLNACRTAEADVVEGLAGLAAAVVTQGGVPAAVGMGYEISTASAAIFAQAFYEALVPYGQVDHAVAKGREAMFLELGSDVADWGVPRLYSRRPEGVILDLI